MLKKLFQAFRPPQSPNLPDPDAELALGALLVRIAQSDRAYLVEEISLIDRILARLYGHNALEAAKVRATCEKLHAAAPETDTFGRLIRETTGLEERLAALDAPAPGRAQNWTRNQCRRGMHDIQGFSG